MPTLRMDYREYLGNKFEEAPDLLQAVIDINHIITSSESVQYTFARLVELINNRIGADACALYLRDKNKIRLRAVYGQNQKAVGGIEFELGQGLVGKVATTAKIINTTNQKVPHDFEELDAAFTKYIKNIPEPTLKDASPKPLTDEAQNTAKATATTAATTQADSLQSFVGVPLLENRRLLGVLTTQRHAKQKFSAEQQKMLSIIGSNLTSFVSKVLLLEELRQRTRVESQASQSNRSIILEGLGIAPGLTMDNVVVINPQSFEEPAYATELTPDEEETLFEEALKLSRQEIINLINKISQQIGEADSAIFHSHLLFLEEAKFVAGVKQMITNGASAAWSVAQVIRRYLLAFDSVQDHYLKERSIDIEDVGMRLLKNLGMRKKERNLLTSIGGILVIPSLTPSDVAYLNPQLIKGIITSRGSYVSHASILARSLRIPAVSMIENVTLRLENNQRVLLDGDQGRVFINPGQELINLYQWHLKKQTEQSLRLKKFSEAPCQTKDGISIILRSNISLPQDIEEHNNQHSPGVGMFSSEATYLVRGTYPSVEELEEDYYKMFSAINGNVPIYFKTLDLIGERAPDYMHFPLEDNPLMGMRSIRYQLKRPSLLVYQLLGLLRAITAKPEWTNRLRIVIPMITRLDELLKVKAMLHNCCQRVANERGIDLPQIPLGMIFEVPSTIVECNTLVQHIDFAFAGTSDLAQYVLGVDRNNSYINDLYDPFEPAVLKLIQQLFKATTQQGIPLIVCGELASATEGCLIMTGMGVREFSVLPPLMPVIKERMASFTIAELEDLSQRALEASSPKEIRHYLTQLRDQTLSNY